MAHGLVYFAAVAKAHFDFGRVYVDIDPRRVDGDVQRIHRLALTVKHVFIRTAGGVAQHLVAHKAAVDIAVLLVRARAGGVWQAGATRHGDAPVAVLHWHGLRDKVLAQHIGQAPR